MMSNIIIIDYTAGWAPGPGWLNSAADVGAKTWSTSLGQDMAVNALKWSTFSTGVVYSHQSVGQPPATLVIQLSW